jgi:hypothetical protein
VVMKEKAETFLFRWAHWGVLVGFGDGGVGDAICESMT